ncbi:TonB-dependent receptor domain-containing protein [Rubrivirga sp. IMCC43871]|uniref:TonB-dependent receptor domain-containing protein n=1 Tax=Rubrivirga sp. IMCC43871 TaxID=3391575 RepID=UPI00398FBBD6
MRLLLLSLLISLTASAQTSVVAGRVVDVEGSPLPGANVVVEGTGRGAAADLGGRFEITGLDAGAARVVATMIGYAPAVAVVELADGARVEVRLALVEAALDAGEVVVTARETLTGRGTLDLPGSGHYVDARAMRLVGNGDIHRVLREVPGVTIQEEDGYGLRPNVGLRGSGAERSSTITLMEDGVLIAPAPYAAPAAYYFPTTGRMDGVEVRTGAGQIKHGPATTGGALNLLAASIPVGRAVRGEAVLGPNGQRTLHARAGASTPSAGWLGGLGVGAVAEVRSDNVDGFKTITGAGGAALLDTRGDELATGFDKTDLFGRVRLATAPGAAVFQSLTLTGSLTDEISDETYLGLTDADFEARPFTRYAGSQRDQMDADQRALRAQHVAVFSSRVDLTTTVYRNAFSRNWYKLDRVAAGGDAASIAAVLDAPEAFGAELAALRGSGTGLLNVKANNRDYLSQGVQTALGVRLGTASRGALVEAGVRLHADEMDRFQWVDQYAIDGGAMTLADAGTPGTDSNRIESARAVAVYVQAEAKLGPVRLTPGLRVESVRLRREDFGKADVERTGADLSVRENTSTALIPGLGAIVDAGRGWRVFGGVHRGYAPPDSRPETNPESSVNSEIGVRYGGGGIEVQAAGFWTAYRNLLGSDLAASGGGGTADQFNGGRVDVRGVEVGISADLARLAGGASAWGVPVRVAYTGIDGRFRSAFESDFEAWGTVAEGDALPYQAAHRLYVRAGVERGGWTAALLANAVSDMRSVAGQGEIPASERIGAHVVFDVVAEAPLANGLTLTARAVNLLDDAYVVARRPAGVRPGLPRTVTVGIRARIGR